MGSEIDLKILNTIQNFFKFMENSHIEQPKNEPTPEELGSNFNLMDFGDFLIYLRQIIKENSSVRFIIVADWLNVDKAHAAKALLDGYASRLHIDSFTIKATSQQYQEDVNAFQSGVQWQEIKK